MAHGWHSLISCGDFHWIYLKNIFLNSKNSLCYYIFLYISYPYLYLWLFYPGAWMTFLHCVKKHIKFNRIPPKTCYRFFNFPENMIFSPFFLYIYPYLLIFCMAHGWHFFDFEYLISSHSVYSTHMTILLLPKKHIRFLYHPRKYIVLRVSEGIYPHL